MTDFPFQLIIFPQLCIFFLGVKVVNKLFTEFGIFLFKLFVFFSSSSFDLSEDAAPAVSVESPFVTVFTAPEKMLLPL